MSDVEYTAIGRADPGFSASNCPVFITYRIVGESSMFKNEDCSLVISGRLGTAKELDRSGSLGVVVFVGNTECRGGGIDHNESRLMLTADLEERVNPCAVIAGKSEMLEAEIFIECLNFRTPTASPCPAEVFLSVGKRVFLVEIEDFGLGRGKVEQRLPGCDTDRGGVAEYRFADASVTSEDYHAAFIEEILHEPIWWPGGLD